MEVTKWLKPSDSVSRLGDSASVQAITRVNAVQLEDQLLFLRDRDPGLYSLIETIQREELMHLGHAEERIVVRPLWPRPKSTYVAIWLSTWGDSTRMARDLAARHVP